MSFLRNNYHKVILLVLSFWIILYQKDGLLSLGDFIFPVVPDRWLYFRWFAWKDFSFLGTASIVDYVNLIHYFPIFVLYKVGIPLVVIQTLLFSTLFFVGSYSIYILTSEILGGYQYQRLIGIICAILYIYNPYVAIVKLRGYNMSIYAYVFAPLILYFFIKYVKRKYLIKNKYLYFLGVSLLLSSPSSTQPAYTTWSFALISFFCILVFFSNKLNRMVIIKLFIVILLYILLSSFWLIPLLFNFGVMTNVINVIHNETKLESISSVSGTSLAEVFRLLGIPGSDAKWRGFSYLSYIQLYNSPVFILIGFILSVLILCGSLFIRKDSTSKKDKFWWFYFFSICLLSIFIVGGANFLFPDFKFWLFKTIPLLLLYRKPYEKGAFFLMFSIVCLLALSLKNISFLLTNSFKNNSEIINKCFFILILFLILIYSFPFWTKQVFTSINHPECTINSLNNYPNYYFQFGEIIEKNKKIGRLLGLPINNSPISSGIENYKWGYAGIDPIYLFVNKGYILLNPLLPFLNSFYQSINSESFDKTQYLLNLSAVDSLFNVNKFILRNDICWQLYNSPNPSIDKKYLESSRFEKTSIGELDVYDVSSEYFLPHVYTPQTLLVSDNSVKDIQDIITQPDYKIRSAIILNQQLIDKSKQKTLEIIPKEIKYTPVLEFKKINPTKYRIIIHGTKEAFPLVFSESYHDRWKGYIMKYQKSNIINHKLEVYKILDGNSDDQASSNELKDYIDKGWISTLGDGREREIRHMKYVDGKENLDYVEKYKIDFVSKNFQGTIQNDNLSNGSVFETWFKKPLDEKNHLVVNGYANSWIIDPNDVCKTGVCKRNEDGSYDMEMVVEFWPQRLFYIGLGISGVTLLACLSYLVYDRLKGRKVRGYA